ncbi:MAG TPA: cytochrome c biogenesis protein ResB [Desulfobacteria bacterium]|nr:cytochrome c biogenesis protein ResB [Desulfobacteria bacterium]
MAKDKNRNDANFEDQKLSPGEPRSSSGESNIVDVIWNFLSSMKLGIALLLIMAIASIYGTIFIPKDQYGRENFISFYNSLPFKLLMGLLSLNLLICSLNRWKSVINTLKGPKSNVSLNFVKGLKSSASFKLKSSPAEAAESVKALLRKRGYRVFDNTEDDSFRIASDKGHLGILGPYLTHFGFLIMLVAIMVKFSGVVGFEGTLAGVEGGTYNLNQLADVQGKMAPEDNFELRINDFRTVFRPDGSVKQWYSDVTVIDGNQSYPYSIYVNNPLVHKGIKFYQSSYGYQFAGKYGAEGNTNQQFTLGPEEYVTSGDISFMPVKYNEATNKITVVTYKGTQGIKQEDVALKTPYKYEKAEITFDKVNAYTVLTVKKDPGVPIAGFGSILLMVAIVISFILRQRRIWAVVTPEKEGSLVLIGGQSAKDKRGLDQDLEVISAELKG